MTDKNPITDFSQAFKAIDPKTLFPFFNSDRFGEWFKSQGFESLDPATIMKVHQDRLQAMARANEQAMSLYRNQLERQAKLFDDVIRETWASLEKTKTSGSSDATRNNLAVYAAAAEKAVALMQQYSEATQAAAEDAFKKLSVDMAAVVMNEHKT